MKSLSLKLVVLWIVVSILGCAAKFEPANPVAFGRNWTFLGVNVEDKSQHSYDSKTVTHSGDVTRFDFRIVDTLGYESIGVAEVDCYKNFVHLINIVKYDEYFRSVGEQPSLFWRYFPPDSIMGINRGRFCK